MSSPAGTTRWNAEDEAIIKAMARDLAAGREIRLPHPYAEDATGSVSVTVDTSRHAAVESIDVAADWREVLAPEAMPNAVFEAYRTALARATHGRILLRVATERAGAATPPADAEPSRPPDDPVERERWRAAVWAAADDALDRSRRALEQSSRPVERRVYGRFGLLTAHLRGRTIVGIDGDPHRIAAASADQLRLEALRVLRGDGHATGPQRPERA